MENSGTGKSPLRLLDGVDEGGHSLHSHFQSIARLDRSNTAWGSGENNVSRKERHVGRNEAHQLVAIENELTRQRVLSELAVLKKLDRQFVRIDLCLHIGPKRRECVERLGACPLTLRLLNRAVANVLGGCVSENIPGCGGGCDVSHPAPDHDGQFCLEISLVFWEWNLDLTPVRNERGGRFEPEKRLFGELGSGFKCVIGIVEADSNYF